MGKAQSALEYLMIIAITMGVIVPTTYLFFRYSSQSTAEIIDSQVNQIGRSITETAESVYYSGEGSKIVLDVNMPNGVNDIYILASRELVFQITTQIGQSEEVFFTAVDIPITSNDASADCISGVKCQLNEIAGTGLKRIRIQSIDDGSGGSEILIERFTE